MVLIKKLRKYKFNSVIMKIDVITGNAYILKLILDANFDPNIVYNYTMSLHYAIRNNNKEIILLLLQYHADIETKNSVGKSPLDNNKQQ